MAERGPSDESNRQEADKSWHNAFNRTPEERQRQIDEMIAQGQAAAEKLENAGWKKKWEGRNPEKQERLEQERKAKNEAWRRLWNPTDQEKEQDQRAAEARAAVEAAEAALENVAAKAKAAAEDDAKAEREAAVATAKSQDALHKLESDELAVEYMGKLKALAESPSYSAVQQVDIHEPADDELIESLFHRYGFVEATDINNRSQVDGPPWSPYSKLTKPIRRFMGIKSSGDYNTQYESRQYSVSPLDPRIVLEQKFHEQRGGRKGREAGSVVPVAARLLFVPGNAYEVDENQDFKLDRRGRLMPTDEMEAYINRPQTGVEKVGLGYTPRVEEPRLPPEGPGGGYDEPEAEYEGVERSVYADEDEDLHHGGHDAHGEEHGNGHATPEHQPAPGHGGIETAGRHSAAQQAPEESGGRHTAQTQEVGAPVTGSAEGRHAEYEQVAPVVGSKLKRLLDAEREIAMAAAQVRAEARKEWELVLAQQAQEKAARDAEQAQVKAAHAAEKALNKAARGAEKAQEKVARDSREAAARPAASSGGESGSTADAHKVDVPKVDTAGSDNAPEVIGGDLPVGDALEQVSSGEKKVESELKTVDNPVIRQVLDKIGGGFELPLASVQLNPYHARKYLEASTTFQEVRALEDDVKRRAVEQRRDMDRESKRKAGGFRPAQEALINSEEIDLLAMIRSRESQLEEQRRADERIDPVQPATSSKDDEPQTIAADVRTDEVPITTSPDLALDKVSTPMDAKQLELLARIKEVSINERFSPGRRQAEIQKLLAAAVKRKVVKRTKGSLGIGPIENSPGSEEFVRQVLELSAGEEQKLTMNERLANIGTQEELRLAAEKAAELGFVRIDDQGLSPLDNTESAAVYNALRETAADLESFKALGAYLSRLDAAPNSELAEVKAAFATERAHEADFEWSKEKVEAVLSTHPSETILKNLHRQLIVANHINTNDVVKGEQGDIKYLGAQVRLSPADEIGAAALGVEMEVAGVNDNEKVVTAAPTGTPDGGEMIEWTPVDTVDDDSAPRDRARGGSPHARDRAGSPRRKRGAATEPQ